MHYFRVIRSAHLALDTGPAEILLRVQTCDTTDFNGGYLERSQEDDFRFMRLKSRGLVFNHKDFATIR